MTKPDRSHVSKVEQATALGSPASAMEAFAKTRRVFKELEAIGVSEFQMFNALADLYYERGQPEISELMAEAAYKCFQRE